MTFQAATHQVSHIQAKTRSNELPQHLMRGMQAHPEANQYFDILAQVSRAISASAGHKAAVREGAGSEI